MAEVFLGAFLQLLLDRLTPRDYFLSCFARVHGVEKTLKRWADKLCGIQSVLQDAEEKQLTAGAVKQWLDDLKDLAYDIEDILDSFYTDLLRRRVNKQNRAGICKVRALFPRVNFNFNLNTNVEEVSVRLQDISERKDRLGLIYIASSSSSTRAWQRPPSSSVVDGALVGRDSDKRKIVGLLSRDGVSPVNFHVVAIVGMGGLGKTTLAGHVFNDDAINEFDIKVWVSVSHNFDIVRVTKAILESVTSVHCALEEFSKVQENLSKELTSKKFLIVLDDVWNTCDYDLWTKLQSPFPVGATGSKIIVTTRDAEVAKMMRAIEIHNLELMSNDDCWKLFEQHAFSDLSTLRQPNFESYKEKVVVKCAGLPLAARTLGGLLGCKEIGDWQEILDNKLWTSDDNGILPVLKLSYHYLPSRVKRCFAYCSILPTDYEFGKKSLILLWMAEGLIQVSQERKKMEDVGGDYFGELLSRSLLQKSSKNDSLYVMHDLVSDLARSVAGETCFRLEDRSDGGCSRKTRHSSYIPGDYDGIKKFEEFSKAELPKLECLRLLSLNGYKIIELPKSIGRLKHIRYLNLSHTLIKSLPKSVCTLYNLQTLILENCSCLQTLPKNIRNLSDLRHLINSNVPLLEGMPVQLGRLTNLQTLSTFVVGVGNHSRIREIGPLSHLQGKICLLQLENVNNVQDARMVDLESKKGLDAVLLEWGSTRENESKVLDILKPHRKLKEITIVGYGGLKFSSWIGHPSFADMTVVRLKNCTSCPFLPLLGQLPSLKELYIAGMSKVKTVGIEFYGESSLPFPQLEILDFRDMHGWKEWFPCEADETAQVFAHLKMLSIYNCPKLEGKLPDSIPLLSKLVINGCEKLVVIVSNYKSLSELLIDNCKVVVHSDAAEFERLKDLQLSNTSKFELQVEAFMRGVSKVESLEISGCEGLTSSWLNKCELLQHLISLCSLTIRGNSHSYFQFVQALTSLQELKIYGCPNLVSFPDAGFPTSVNKLWIHGCSSLEYIVRYQMPPSLRILTIRNCENLKSLIERGEEVGSSSPLSLMQQEASSLEYFDIDNCPSLVSLSFGRCFPKALKQLLIDSCEKLESISNPFSNSTSLEEIVIWRCQNFKSLPEGLYDLINLHTLAIWDCASLVAVPRSASQSLQNLNSLQKLYLDYRQGFTSSLREGFPPNLIQLSIWDLESCEPLLFEWGLHRLTSLRVLTISVSGEDPELVSFPPEKEEETQMLLPKSLVRLSLCAFPNLSKLSKGLQYLTSLQSLDLWHCPKLACLPEEGLPYSLTQLYIHGCPLLEERCKAGYIGRNAYWSSIAHIPYIELEDWKNTDSPS